MEKVKRILTELVGIGVILFACGIVLWLGLFAYGMVKAALDDSKEYPGKTQFTAEASKINVYKDKEAFGNTPQAEEVAALFSTELKELCAISFVGGNKFKPATGGHFLTYCRITPTDVVILCHVPDLRGYQDKTRDLLSKIAWGCAQSALETKKIDSKLNLVVGLRGFGSYGPVMEGKGEGAPTISRDGVEEVKRIYPYFTH
jgi:hypothetical protein